MGVVLLFPTPVGFPIEATESGAGFQPHTAYIQTQSPLVKWQNFRYNGGRRSNTLLCGRVCSRIGAWGVGALHVLPYICLGVVIVLRHSRKGKYFLVMKAALCVAGEAGGPATGEAWAVIGAGCKRGQRFCPRRRNPPPISGGMGQSGSRGDCWRLDGCGHRTGDGRARGGQRQSDRRCPSRHKNRGPGVASCFLRFGCVARVGVRKCQCGGGPCFRIFK